MLPEAQLWTHVIIQAIRDSEAPALSKAPAVRRYAKHWLASSNEEVGSFLWACQLINVDPHFIRSALMKTAGPAYARKKVKLANRMWGHSG
jgi:uncharacterized protein YfaT (DUF1175 family)